MCLGGRVISYFRFKKQILTLKPSDFWITVTPVMHIPDFDRALGLPDIPSVRWNTAKCQKEEWSVANPRADPSLRCTRSPPNSFLEKMCSMPGRARDSSHQRCRRMLRLAASSARFFQSPAAPCSVSSDPLSRQCVAYDSGVACVHAHGQ